jgi:hypothetical protein
LGGGASKAEMPVGTRCNSGLLLCCTRYEFAAHFKILLELTVPPDLRDHGRAQVDDLERHSKERSVDWFSVNQGDPGQRHVAGQSYEWITDGLKLFIELDRHSLEHERKPSRVAFLAVIVADEVFNELHHIRGQVEFRSRAGD